MGSILVAMPKYEDSKHIAGILRECGLYLDIEACTTGADVLRILHDRDFGVIVCTKRLSDMGYAELAEYLPNYFGMIVLTKDPSLETVSDQMVKLMLPLKRSELKSTIEMMTNEFYYQIRRKKRKVPKRSVKEQKMIDDAKAKHADDKLMPGMVAVYEDMHADIMRDSAEVQAMIAAYK